jgi:hypothetical protein
MVRGSFEQLQITPSRSPRISIGGPKRRVATTVSPCRLGHRLLGAVRGQLKGPMHINAVMHETVGYLCTDHHTDQGVEKLLVGTCLRLFLTIQPNGRERVIGDCQTRLKEWLEGDKRAYIRLNTDPPSATGVFVPLRHDWRFHQDASVDIAVLPMRGPSGTGGMHNVMDAQDIIDTPAYVQR